jgi:hypothetical protein
MYPHSFLWHYLWIAPQVLQLAVAIIIVQRKLHKEFPAFLLYIIFEIVFNSALFVLDHDPSITWYQYRWAESMGDGFSIVLRFAVIQEIFSIVCDSYPSLNRIGTAMFRGAAVLLFAVAVAIAFHTPGAEYAPRVVAGLVVLNRAVAIVQCGLLLLLFLFASYFRLPRRSYVFGIATGLGIFSAVQLATAAIRSQVQVESRLFIDFLPMITYHCCVLIWLFYLLVPEPVWRAAPSVPTHDLESWNRELQRLLQR